MNFEKTIADNYSSYIDDERGYSHQAWDITPIEEIRSHDRILHLDAKELAAIDTTAFSDLERWAFVRALRTQQLTDAIFTQCDQLITSKTTHPALNYSEIFEFYLEQLAKSGRIEQARKLLENTQLPELPPDLEGILALLTGDETSARDIFKKLIADHPDEAELHFDIAEDFARHGFAASSLEWLNTALEVANRTKDAAVVVDIELLRLEITTNAAIIEE